FLTSGKYDNVGAYFKGYLNIPADGAYRFQLECDDLASMVIDGVKVIDCDSLTLHSNPARLHNGFIPLKAGLHPFSISYYENTSIAKLILRYEGPGFKGLELLPKDMFSYSKEYFTTQAETDDSDLDGLINTLDPNDVNSDSDGDKISDGEEYKRRLDPARKTVFIYVDGMNGLDTNDGLSAAKSKGTIAAGIGCWKDDKNEYVVSVRALNAGTPIAYSGEGNTDITIDAKPYLKIRPWPEEMEAGAQTVVDCRSSGRAFTFTNVQESTEIEGFKFKNCMTIDDGGALKISNSQLSVINCSFLKCMSAGSGGAVSISGGSPVLYHCIFEKCIASFSGGAVAAASGSGLKLTRSRIFNCQASQTGGAVMASSSPVMIENCFIAKNSSSYGAVSSDTGASDAVTVSSCTIADNISMSAGAGGLYFSGTTPCTVVNTVLWNNGNSHIGGATAPSVTFSDVQGGYAGTGNINLDPVFVDALTNDYHLKDESPCIDAGTSAGAPAGDIDEYTRPYADECDIGADEYYAELPEFGISPSVSKISEGGTCQIKVRLKSRPKETVIIDCRPDSGVVSLDTARLTFTPESWRIQQVVTVSAVQDSYVPGTAVNVVFSIYTPRSDMNFAELSGQSASVEIKSDDVAGFSLSVAEMSILENGATGTFTAVLSAQPENDVVLRAASSSTDEATVDTSSLTFTKANWNISQQITVTGVNDHHVGNDTAMITVSVDPASDSFFRELAAGNVTVTLLDDGLLEDADSDGLADDFEYQYFGNLDQGPDDDFDNDGLTNKKECELGTNPKLEDTDGDGIRDGDEVNIHNTDPLKADTDLDGISDGDEIARGTDPNSRDDTDSDGLPDDWERFYFNGLAQDGTDNPDFDGFINFEEFIMSTSPATATADDAAGTIGLRIFKP
ncbi:MAG: PA14 domain-containing protein, partial [Victivallales bacterium]